MWGLWMGGALLCAAVVLPGPAAAQEPEAATADSMDARDTFAREAWLLEREPLLLAGGLSLPPGFGEKWRVVDGTGAAQDPAIVQEAVADPKLSQAMQSVKRGTAMQWTWVAVSITGVLVPVVAAVPGAVVGAVLGGLFVARDRSTTTADLPTQWTPLALGVVAGLGMGLGAGAAVGALLVGMGGALLGAFVPGRDANPELAAVREHNRALAKALGLDPATLPAQYFPAAR